MADRDDSTGLPDPAPWAMPPWMEAYRGMVESGGGGNTAEDLMQRLRVGGARLLQTNVYVYFMAIEVDTKIRLLTALYQAEQLAWSRPPSLAEPDLHEPCGCLTNQRGWHRRECPTWELIGPLAQGNWVLRTVTP